MRLGTLSKVHTHRIVNERMHHLCFLFLSIRSFPTARAVFHHACSAHVKHSSDFVCLWNGCERIKRQKWALISHIQVD